ncbi:hypothetical protein FRB93_009671 [Tulasnella sp. JGI-2019a]|nr:hypothetical protein FRB93_009671 [Tulasnella sp. JGI-2019a]
MGRVDKVTVILVATILSLTLWVFYVCLFIKTILVLRLRGTSALSLPVITISVAFFFNLGDTACRIVTTYKGFVRYPDGPLAYFTLYDAKLIDRNWTAAINFCISGAAFAAEVLMIWRLFVIWSRNKRVIYLPLVLLAISTIGCALLVLFDILESARFKDPEFIRYESILTVGALGADIILTWYITGLICYRLWSMERQKRQVAMGTGLDDLNSGGNHVPSRYGKVTTTLIQSGMLLSVTEVALVACTLAKNATNGKDTIDYLLTRIIGITTLLIMLQLNTGVPDRRQQPTGIGISAFSMPVFRVVNPDDEVEPRAEMNPTDEKERKSGIDQVSFVGIDEKLTCSATSSSSTGAEPTDGLV